MFNFSFLDTRLLFPNITESGALLIESCLTIVDVISIILIVLAEWRLFKKLGEKPWKSLVPYYNSYILYKHAWSRTAFWVYLISSTLFGLVQSGAKYFSQNMPESMWMSLLGLLTVPLGIVTIVCSILYAIRLAEAFGKGKFFSVGLLLVYFVFISILGFGKSQYIGNGEGEPKCSDAEDPKSKEEAI